MTLLNFQLKDGIYKNFKKKCIEEGITMSEVMRILTVKFIIEGEEALNIEEKED